MSNFVDFLRTCEAAICDTFGENLKALDGGAFGEAIGYDGRPILEAIVQYRISGSQSAALAWAATLTSEASRVKLSYPQVLASLQCLANAVRHHAAAQLSQREQLVAVLDEFDDALDLLRRCTVLVRLTEQEEPRPSRHEFATLAEQCVDFVCLATLHGKVFYLNPAGRRLIGLGEDEDVTGINLHEFHSDEAWTSLRDEAVPAVNRRGRWEGPSQLWNRTTAELIDVSATLFFVRAPDTGKPTCLALVHRKATEPPKLAGSLDESEARKHAILESSLDPIITINHEGRITEFNRAAEQVFGYPRSEILGTRPSEVLFPPAKIAGQQDRIDRYLEAGEGSMLGKRVEVTAVRASGELFPAEMAMTLSRERGLPVMTFFVRDISQQKRAEEEQVRYAAELERSNEELEQFAYVASHDLQEPLRKICTFGDRLQRLSGQSLDPKAQECVQRMGNAAQRMQTLINGLLTLSRVMTKGREFVQVDLAQIAAEVVSDLEIQIEQAGAVVELGKLPTIQADPLQMRQLLQNLIGNALKFRRENESPRVKVQARYVHGREQREAGQSPIGEQCRITVEDNGIGFDEKYADRIFGIFQRLHSREAYEGTGIGLAICRKIVERHGGTITARSTVGQGTTFDVLLPVVHRKQKT
jgi:two-component system sensor kinase FixL